MCKIKYLIIPFILSALICWSQEQISDGLIQDFQNGKLFVINKVAIAKADSIFFKTLAQEEFDEYQYLKPEEGIKKYGTIGENGVHQIEAQLTQDYKAMKLSILEAYILKDFNQEKGLLYMIDGAPNQDVYIALQLLINKKIEKVQHLKKNQAKAIWAREGENGAMMIHTVKDEKLEFE